MVFLIYSLLLSEILDVKPVWTGLNDVLEEEVFRFQNGKVASINAHDEEPSEDDDLFIKWKEGEPNNFGGGEDSVVIDMNNKFVDVTTSSKFRPACEIPNPHCFEGTRLLFA